MMYNSDSVECMYVGTEFFPSELQTLTNGDSSFGNFPMNRRNTVLGK